MNKKAIMGEETCPTNDLHPKYVTNIYKLIREKIGDPIKNGHKS